MNLKIQTSAFIRALFLLLAGLVLYVQFHNLAHAFEHVDLEPGQICEHCLVGHDSEVSLAVLSDTEPLLLAQQELTQISDLIFKSHKPSFNHPQSRAPPLS